jgi:UDP-N-acetylmuramate: L-alanyl-gamma-D-glutamyl-meso-diaminopimelate ligase
MKHIHVVGIAGVATSALAIAFHKKGYKVTGSDKGFFPPVSTELERAGVSFHAGYHPEKMVADGIPDIVIVGTASGSSNPETVYAKEHGIPMYSFAEAIGEFFVRENSVVCVGTWGKTSSSAMLSYILSKADFDPSYMFGGISLSHESSACLSDSAWSVFEGDEYKSSPTDNTPKFAYYKPTHLLLTAVSWDHADLYPTEDQYFKAFDKLVGTIPPTKGFIVGCKDHPGVRRVIDDSAKNKKVIWYGKRDEDTNYTYSDIKQGKDGITFIISHGDRDTKIHSPMIGAFQAENITGCFAMAHELGVPEKTILDAIGSFVGIKRRLEKRLDGATSSSGVTVFDDIAHSPEKASSVIKNLREIYEGKITIVFEPNIGGRRHESAQKYNHAFDEADRVIIARLTKLKVADDDTAGRPYEGDELAKIIGATTKNTEYIDNDDAVIDSLSKNTKKGDVIAFLGSHGFRGMIESVVEKLK